jgi:hypothetical protein
MGRELGSLIIASNFASLVDGPTIALAKMRSTTGRPSY